MSLGADLAEVLDIQVKRTSDPKDPVMRERRVLVEKRIPAALEQILQPIEPTLRAEGSSGKGAPAEVPWTRFYDPELSGRAGIGWYVVYLFSASGNAVYLSLNQGTTTWVPDKDDFVFRTVEELEARVESARTILRTSGLQSHFDGIDLKAKQRLGRAYQAGNVHAIRYTASDLGSDQTLATDIRRMAEMLDLLYESQMRGVDFDRPDELDLDQFRIRAPRRTSSSVAAGAGIEVTAGVTAEVSVWTPDVVLPSVTDDDTTGPDMLGVDADARALAAVIAAKQVVPPLAVALYGEWGSGKTYFMHRVEAHIKRFGRGDRDGRVFEPATGHIRFKAWHYERGHLMASLHKQIFEALDFRGPRAPREVWEADRRVEKVKHELADATSEVTAAEAAHGELQQQIEAARSRHDDQLAELKSITVSDIWAQAKSDPKLQEQIEAASKALNLPAAQDSALDLMRTAREVQALGTRIKVLGTPGRRWWSSPLLGAAAAVLLALALTAVIGSGLSDSLRSMGTAIGVAASLASGLATGVARQIGIVRRFLEPAEKLQAVIEERLEAKRAEQQNEINELETQLTAAEQALMAAVADQETKQRELDDAKHRRDELTPALILQRFITDRAQTSEYDEDLGIVTRVHQDLYELSQCLNAALADQDSVLKRIVLYIDDLDRCSPTTVVAVLEAVHLFLALPHFVVIVGVDHRSLETSLRSVHHELMTGQPEAATPADYLEKIFRLTFTLPPMTQDGCRAILTDAINRLPVVEDFEIGGPAPEDDPDAVPDEAIEGAGSPSHPEQDSLPARESVRRDEQQDEPDLDPYVIRSLDITDNDRELLSRVAPLVATTPRRAKRFLTIYAVVRARLAGIDYDPAAIVLLVAALVGAPNTLGRKLRQVDSAAAVGVSFQAFVGDGIHDQRYLAESVRVAQFTEAAGELMNVPVAAVIAHRQEITPYTIGINHDVLDLSAIPAGGN
ncbi:MrcB family domain-containing protein [Nocardia sp. NPDC056000]|uniref:MrcB family domain-containing protein n=1 Tax=Nocardia sp. NPDC056000 TaxID=3345674 RepID=UPI0035DC9019